MAEEVHGAAQRRRKIFVSSPKLRARSAELNCDFCDSRRCTECLYGQVRDSAPARQAKEALSFDAARACAARTRIELRFSHFDERYRTRIRRGANALYRRPLPISGFRALTSGAPSPCPLPLKGGEGDPTHPLPFEACGSNGQHRFARARCGSQVDFGPLPPIYRVDIGIGRQFGLDRLGAHHAPDQERMTNVTSTGAQAGVVEVSHPDASENSRETGVEPKFSDPSPSSVQNGEPGGYPPEEVRFKSAEPEQAPAEPAPSEGPRFDSLGLSADLLKAVEQSGYTTPTPIQAQGIPHVLQRRDIIGIAQTGTGKTASLHPADDRAAGARPRQGAHAALADPGADARTRGAGRRELREIRQVQQAFDGAADRRRLVRRPGPQARPRRRRADRDAGPPARPFRARQADADARCRSSSSTKPTACSTWASFPTSSASAS